jgi:protein-tyrosine sulfotransferase
MGRGKYQWCEKTTLNINYLSILSKIFPESKFICLYRNCLDVINSCIATSSWGFMAELAPYVKNNPDNFIAAMAESWLEKNQKLFAFEQLHQDRCFRLTYESLVTEPNNILASLFKFLDLEWDDQLLSKVFTTHHDNGDGDTRILFTEKISQASVGKGGRIPLSNLQEDLCEKINNLHNVLGYQSIQSLHAAMTSTADPASRANENTCEKELDLSLFFESKVTEIVRSKHDEFRFRNCICKFVISGVKGGTWILDTTGKKVTFRKGETNDADCSITLSYQTFYDIFRGDINPVDAYDQREIHVDGNIETALRYGKLLFDG